MPLPCRHISVSIACSAAQAYRFAANPRNLPRWASGLSEGIAHENGEWIAQSLMGRVRVAFAGENPYGILDHEVMMEDGSRFYNPMRVFANGEGCEMLFTLFEHPGMSRADIEKDAATILSDLEQLKTLLEGSGCR